MRRSQPVSRDDGGEGRLDVIDEETLTDQIVVQTTQLRLGQLCIATSELTTHSRGSGGSGGSGGGGGGGRKQQV